MSTYTRSELENSGQCHQKSIGALPLSSMLRVEPGLILIIGVASCAYTIREISFREIHIMMNSRNIQPAKILRCTVKFIKGLKLKEILEAKNQKAGLKNLERYIKIEKKICNFLV